MTTKLKSWLVLALVFGAGFTAGVVVTRDVVRHYIQKIVRNPDRVRDLLEQRLTHELRLDANQRQQVHLILGESQKDLRELRREFAPPFLAIVSNAETRVAAVLTPQQRERFARFRDENRRLWESKPKP